MSDSSLTAISPLDGRYADALSSLRERVSEFGLIRYRVRVEVEWLIHLSAQPDLGSLPALTGHTLAYWRELWSGFDLRAAARVKELEKIANHDAKAVEYFLREACAGHPQLEAAREFIHFACTSEDINNLAYGLMLRETRDQVLLPALHQVLGQLIDRAEEFADLPMLSRTHGQPASPTTMGKEFANVAWRLARQVKTLQQLELLGKCNGAVGNYNAHLAACPDLDWPRLCRQFVEGLGLQWNPYTTQIEPHDSLAEFAHNLVRVNSVLLDLCRDWWGYISLGYFAQKLKPGEVGSSTMPHKVNPIDFENAEGNLGMASALLDHLAVKLPVSRWQRDLSDSTVLRNYGGALGYLLLALQSIRKGLDKLTINRAVIDRDLLGNWEVLGEAIQTLMRRHAVPEPYEQLKKLTRGKSVDRQTLHAFIDAVPIPEPERERLKQLTPAGYTGKAADLAAGVRSAVGALQLDADLRTKKAPGEGR